MLPWLLLVTVLPSSNQINKMDCSERRKKYDMRTERKEVYPREVKKPRRKQRKKYYLRKNEGILKHEIVCGRSQDPSSFFKVYINTDISYGVFTTTNIEKNDILLEYKGKLITRNEAEELHKYYASKGLGCYIVDFVHNEQKMCIDATETFSLGRYVNDSVQKYANCEMKKYVIDDVPHLCLVAKKDIPANEELRYDYGDSKNMYWRGLKHYNKPLTLEEVTGHYWKSAETNNNNGDVFY